MDENEMYCQHPRHEGPTGPNGTCGDGIDDEVMKRRYEK